MRPALRQLEYIIAIAEMGQISLAAANLNVSQPSLSAQLAEVEADLGVSLFHLSRSGVRITPMGEENTQDLDAGLRGGRLDMIISTPEDHPAATSYDIVKERLWVTIALDHPLVNLGTTVRLEELGGQTFMTLGAGHRLSHIVAGLATRAGGRVSDEYEGTSLDALRLMAAAGTELAILPNIYAATEASRGLDVHIARIDDSLAERTVLLLQLAAKGSNPECEILVQALRDGAKSLIQGF